MQSEAELTLRTREERDLAQVVSWVPDADALFLFSGSRLSWPLTANQLREVTAASGLVPYVVIALSGELVGHFDLCVVDGVARLGRVILDPTLRGRGCSRTVIDFALAEAQRLGAERVRLNVIASNTPAIRAYRRAGFRARPADRDRPDVIIMERTAAGSAPRA